MHRDLVDAVGRCSRLALKPRQKLDLVSKYLLPAYYHLFIADLPSLNGLTALDAEIRRRVKIFMHLPEKISAGIIYGRRKDGGLGLPKLEDLVRAAVVKAEVAQAARADPVYDVLFPAGERIE